MRKPNVYHTSFVFNKWRYIVDWDVYDTQLLILNYFYAIYTPPILLKNHEWGLMSILVQVNLSMRNRQYKILNITFGLDDQEW